MKKSFTLIVLALSVSALFAQYTYPEKENSSMVLKSKLAVQLLDENEEIDRYSNQALKEMFAENWTLTEVVFLPKAEINEMKKAKKTGYAYLSQTDAVREDNRSRYITSTGRASISGPAEGTGRKTSVTVFTFSFYEFELEIVNPKNKLETVTKIGFANGELSNIDYLFLTQQLSQLIESSAKGVSSGNYYQLESKLEKIKNSTLIMQKDLIREEEIDLVSVNYEYKYELVDNERYQDVILNKEAANVYAKIIWSHQHQMYMWVIVDAATGAILSQNGFGGIKFGKNHEANEIIKVKYLKYATAEQAQKANSKY